MTFTEKIKLVFSNVWAFLEPFVKTFMTRVGQLLASIALDIVTQIAQDPALLSKKGEEKRAIAFLRIKERLISEGVSMAASDINAAIEAAVKKLKAE